MSAKALLSASVSAGPAAYVEDVFSTYLYTGNGSTQTITNGIDLSGEGGLVWIKQRSTEFPVGNHYLYDTTRGAQDTLSSNTTEASYIRSGSVTSFSSSGFSVGNDSIINGSGRNLASWTFRKAEKFFDVVTYTGDASDQVVSHSLGSTPGCIIIKPTSGAGDWIVYHRGLTNSGANYSIKLNTTAAEVNQGGLVATDSTFTLYHTATVNTSGTTYVAYLFAHDAGGFGDAGTDSVVSCGTFTTDGSRNATVSLGYEPQWFLVKRSSGSDSWYLLDNMRGFTMSADAAFQPNASDAEVSLSGYGYPTATGWSNVGDNAEFFTSSTYIYIAIRRGPMKTPTVGTEVFSSVAGTASSGTVRNTNIVFDMTLFKGRTDSGQVYAQDRLRGFPATDTRYLIRELYTTTTGSEGSGDGYAVQHGINNYQTQYVDSNYYSGYSYILHAFRRAPGFFDVVAYTGTQSGSGSQTVNHNLGVAPELLIHKQRNATGSWFVHALFTASNSKQGILNGANSFNTSTYATNDVIASQPTSSQVSFGFPYASSPNTYIAYLFATLAGVSKVGSYTGTGTTLSIDCGFTAGARFILIKRTDSTGDWYFWDTARGIILGNDPYLRLNLAAPEVTNTDYIDPLSSGFQITSTAPAAINASGGTYIFLAIA
jgi:hypothetical protein